MAVKVDPLGGWSRLPADSLPVVFSRHALERFIERCRPGLDREGVYRELCRLLRSAEIRREAPEWVNAEHDMVAFLILGEDIVLPLSSKPRDKGALVAVTALVANSPGDENRARRSETRARRSARAAEVRRRGKLQRARRRPIPPPVIDDWRRDAEAVYPRWAPRHRIGSMSNVGSTEEAVLLQHLFEKGGSTERALEVALGDVDQIGPEDIADWAEDAEGRGLIEQVEGRSEIRRWQITDAGRRAIGDEPGR